MDIRKVAMFLAWKLPPHYLTPNQARFRRVTKNIFPEYVEDSQLDFIEKQSKQTEDLFFMVLDDIYKDFWKSKEVLELFKKLEITNDILWIEENNKLELKEYKDEDDFTKNFLLDFFRKLWFSDVKFTHGRKEYWKDIIMRKKDELWNWRYVWVQAKVWDVSWRTAWPIDELVWQAIDAFWMSIPDLDEKKKVTISEFIIVTNWKISENAVEKILEKIKEPSQLNNISFIDKTKILNLLDTFK